ncbi:hypothetical protein [Caballeronia sp. LZ043]|uniref:hypothetical protein n=1 Tax=Caballeronia sp. LZ043 TaxID=3038569 RepID=UPI002854A219|nr:hypothetical protein [Caballeronia sp. LZ043]MDR5822390.1 hypothetical protein [Caballeronia sp. LZ043]
MPFVYCSDGPEAHLFLSSGPARYTWTHAEAANWSVAPNAQTQAREFGSVSNAGSAKPGVKGGPTVLSTIERRANGNGSTDSIERASRRIIGTGNAGMELTDNTVDADAKSHEIRLRNL